MIKDDYIRLSELAKRLGLNVRLVREYTGHYTLTPFIVKIKRANKGHLTTCTHFNVSPHSLIILKDYLMNRRKNISSTIKAIEILNKWIQELINENNRERKRNITQAVPT